MSTYLLSFDPCVSALHLYFPFMVENNPLLLSESILKEKRLVPNIREQETYFLLVEIAYHM